MTPKLDRLPPEQRAVLSLVLERGKSYGEVADMLAIPESAVRERAHAALDALANDPASHAQGTLAGDPTSSRTSRSATTERTSAAGTSRSRSPSPSAMEGLSDSAPRPPRDPRRAASQVSSRRAGALLLGGIVVVIAVAVILISSGGGKSSSHTPTTTSKATTSTPSADKPTLDKTITLTATEPELKASGLAYVLSEGNRRAFYVAAQGLPPSSGFFYAVWLYNSPSSSAPLGKAPTVSSNGRMEGGGPLPTNAGSYSRLIITRETSSHPTSPGPIVMSGAFALH
jgi:hypothetical protein